MGKRVAVALAQVFGAGPVRLAGFQRALASHGRRNAVPGPGACTPRWARRQSTVLKPWVPPLSNIVGRVACLPLRHVFEKSKLKLARRRLDKVCVCVCVKIVMS